MKYRKKPIIIEAVQFRGGNREEVLSFIYPTMSKEGLNGAKAMKLPIVIETLEGDMSADVGDFIIKGIKGEFYPCKPDIFKDTYDKVNERGE